MTRPIDPPGSLKRYEHAKPTRSTRSSLVLVSIVLGGVLLVLHTYTANEAEGKCVARVYSTRARTGPYSSQKP